MNYILSVLGTTASGKTSFALDLARKLIGNKSATFQNLHDILPAHLFDGQFKGVDLISADSRQVYSEIPIITGADIPESMSKSSNLQFDKQFFATVKEDIRLHGVGIIDRYEDWSVSHFKNFAIPIITAAWKSQRLPIIVGGTGLYHKQLYSNDPNLYVPPNKQIREKAQEMSVGQLQKWLEQVDSHKLHQMNHSDKHNPRRLVRAMEIATGEPRHSEIISFPKDTTFEPIQIGMKLTLEQLEKRIRQRVLDRVDQGAIKEAQRLENFCQNQDHQICATLGLSDIFSYLKDEISLDECIENWSLHEYQYAKRQLTWFQKNPDIIWLDSAKKKQYTDG